MPTALLLKCVVFIRRREWATRVESHWASHWIALSRADCKWEKTLLFTSPAKSTLHSLSQLNPLTVWKRVLPRAVSPAHHRLFESGSIFRQSLGSRGVLSRLFWFGDCRRESSSFAFERNSSDFFESPFRAVCDLRHARAVWTGQKLFATHPVTLDRQAFRTVSNRL